MIWCCDGLKFWKYWDKVCFFHIEWICIFGGQGVYCFRLFDVLTKRYAHPNPCNLWIYLKWEKRRKEKDQGLCSLQMWLRQEFWDGEIILDCPSDSSCNYSVLLRGRQRQIWQKRRQCDHQAEIVLKWPQAKKGWYSSKEEAATSRFSFGASEESMTLLAP